MKKTLLHIFVLFSLFWIPFLSIFNTGFEKWLAILPVLFVFRKSLFRIIIQYKTILFPWILFCFYCFLSSFLSISVANSLASSVDQFGYLLYFLTLIAYSKQFGMKKLYLLTFVYVIMLYVASSILSFPSFHLEALNLPDLIFPKFGHNHIGFFSLLLIPPSFYALTKNKSLIDVIFFVSLVVILVTSGGRIILVLGFLELLFLVKKFNRNRPRIRWQFNAVQAVLLIALSGAILWFGFFSARYTGCTQSTTWMCKQFRTADRMGYVQSALISFKDKPFFGSGLGTYRINSRRLATSTGAFSSHAHNFLVEMLSDLGVVGFSILIILLLSLVRKILEQAGKSSSNWQQKSFFALGLAFCFISSSFDFDWNTPPTLLITLVVLSMGIFDTTLYFPKVSLGSLEGIREKLLLVLSILLIPIFAIMVLVGSIQLILVALTMPNLACKLYGGNPSMYRHFFSKDLERVDVSCKEKLNKYFYNDPDYWVYMGDNANSDFESMYYLVQLSRLDPWVSFGSSVDYFLDNNQPNLAKIYIDESLSNYRQLATSKMDNWRLARLTSNIFKYGNYLFSVGQYEEAGKYHLEAYNLDPWVFSYNESPIEGRVAQSWSEVEYFTQIKQVPSNLFFRKSSSYSNYFLTLAITSNCNISDDTVSELLQKVTSLSESFSTTLWSRFFWTCSRDNFESMYSLETEERKRYLDLASNAVGVLKNTHSNPFADSVSTDDEDVIARELTNLSQVALYDREISLAFDFAWASSKFVSPSSAAAALPGLVCENAMNLPCAQQQYQACLNESGKNIECQSGLERVVANKPNGVRYWSIVKDH